MTRTASSRPTFTLRRRLLFSAVAVLLGLALVESAARVVEIWRPPRTIDYGRGFGADSRVFAPSPTRPGFSETGPGKDTFFRVQSFSTRKPSGTLRIVVLGGSSVYLLQEEFLTMEGRLLAELSPRFDHVEVLNAGGLSYGSGRLVGVALEVLDYDPDVVVLYEANNEFAEMRQLQLAALEDKSLQHSLSWSAVVRLVRDLSTDRQRTKAKDELAAQYARAGPTPNPMNVWGIENYEVTPDEVDRRMRAFEANCGFIARTCLARGVRFIIGAVPSNLVRPFRPGVSPAQYDAVADLIRQGRYADADALGRAILAAPFARHQSSDVENGIIRRLARDLNVPLLDIEEVVRAAEPHHIPGETLFRDHCHLDDRGNAMLRAALETSIVKSLNTPLVAPPATK